MNIRKLSMVLIFAGIFMATASEARAQGECHVYFMGDARDVFNNVTYFTNVDDVAAYQTDSYTCYQAANDFMRELSYSLCFARSASVQINYIGETYFDSVFLGNIPAPSSCINEWGLNSYSTMTGGQTLYPTDSIASPNNSYHLDYQSDANLVLYGGSGAVWAINCWPTCTNIGSAGRATMQTDGNFVVYDNNNNPVFHTQSNGNYGAFLAIRDNGRLVVYGTNGDVLWAD